MIKIISLVSSFMFFVNCAQAECTRDEAFNKMMKLNQLSTKLQAEVPLDPRTNPDASNAAYERITDYSARMAPTGQMLADGKYAEVCKIYDETATHFGFDMKSSTALTMEQLAKDGGKKGGKGCDITEMAKRNVELATSFQKAYEAGKFTYERQRQFSKDSEKLNMLATSDPGAACREIDSLRAKYGL